MRPRARQLLLVALGSFTLVAASGCQRAGAEPDATEERSSALAGFEPGTAITPAGLVSLGLSSQAVRLGPRGHFKADLAFANGGVSIGSDSDTTSPWRVGGNISVEPQARMTGDLTIGGTLIRGAQTTINGTIVEHATVPRLKFPSTVGLLGQLGANFGTGQSADIFVGPGLSQTLPAGGRRVGNVTLQGGATLTVSGVSALEVMGTVNIGPQARITVRNGGRLILYVHQNVETSTDAVIEQAGQALGRGLIVALGSGATMHWGTNARFGPGLIYGSEPPGSTRITTLADVVTATGSLVTSEMYTSPTSQITLTSRYLACVGGLAPVTVTFIHPAGNGERTVPRGTKTIPIEGTVNGAAGLDSLTVQDAGAARPLTAGADGHFTGTATLRTDGEPTNICVVAKDCQDRVTQSCVLVAVRHDLELSFTSPMPGDRVNVSAINITGRISGGTPVRVSANGVTGGMLKDAFTIPRVPLTAGANVITVDAQAASGDIARRRLLVIQGTTTNVWDGNLEIDDTRHVRVLSRSAVTASPFPLVRLGALSYRLLDANGVMLYQSSIPGTNDTTTETVDVNGLPVQATARPPRTHVSVRVPAVAAARVIQFLDESGQEIGRQTL